MAGPTVLFLLFPLFLIYCHAEQQTLTQEQSNSQPQQVYGYLQPSVYSRQIRIADHRLPLELEMLAQQPLVKRERIGHHEWSACEFSPMSCLLRRRRQVY